MVNNPYLWSTTAGDNSNVDGINFAEGQAPASVNNSARQLMASAAALFKDLAGGVGAGGTANALTVTTNSTFSTLADGLIVAFKASANNTGAATLNVNAIGAKAIRKMDSTGDVALVANEIRDNGVYIVQYSVDANSAAGGWVLVNPSISATLFTLAAVMTATSAGALTLSGTGPVITVTDTDTGADNLISMANSTGSILLSADHNNEVADSGITLAVDGSIIGNVASDGLHLGKTSGAIATPGHSLFSNGLFQTTRAGGITGQFNRTGNDGTIVEWMTSGTARGSVSISGSTTSYNTTSDKRKKEDWQPFDAGYIIDRLEVWNYAWKKNGTRAYGVLAQDCYEVFPDPVIHDPETDFWGVDYSKFVPLLIQEVKDLRKRLERAGVA